MTATQATFAATLVDEWVRAGVAHAVVCPGSRSTPLALALGSRPELAVHVRLDERGAGFFAIGLARATGRPAIVCVTSGTAAAELHAAVVEAHHDRVPLIVCTADRPPELHGVGAPQTIEQSGLYGSAVRWTAEPGVPSEATRGSWRSLAARAVVEAESGPLGPGPVHLNLAFRDPLVGDAEALPPGRPGGRPFHRVAPAGAGALPEGVSVPGGRGLLQVGAGCGPRASVLRLAEHLGWPVLADPRSGCRVRHPHVVAAADAIARSDLDELRPDVVVRLGSPWASKALPAFLSGAETVAVDPWWRWEDPDRTAGLVYRADPVDFAELLCLQPAPRAPEWLERWQRAERTAQGAIDHVLAELGLSEPLVARRVAQGLPGDATVVVSSSMPVRDLEWFAPAVAAPPRVLANRGANGIDGVTSMALGVAAAGQGPVVAVLGDLAFFHDVSALVGAGDAAGVGAGDGSSCTVLVVDNGGGGIFEFLPQAGSVPRGTFDQVFGTPQSSDVVQVAAGLGLETTDVGSPEELDGVLEAAPTVKGRRVARVRVPNRPGNVEVHLRIHAAVADALEGR